VSVQLYNDSNGNGTLNAGEPLLDTKTSNSTGAYLFDIAVPTVTKTVLDQFNTNGSGSGNNGTDNWSGGWTESGENDGLGSGSVLVTGNRLRIGNSSRGASRSANLTGALSAQLSFSFDEAGLDNGFDYLSVQVSTGSSGPWTTLEVLSLYDASGTKTYDISGYISSATSVRFVSSSYNGSLDYFYLDNVQISYTTYSTATRNYIVQLSNPLPAGFAQSSAPSVFPVEFSTAGDSKCGINFGLTGADLSIQKTDSPDPVMAGQNITYTITVTNNGPTNAANVVVNDVLPAGLTLVSATPSTGTWSTPNWTIGTLTIGASETLIIEGTSSASLAAGTIISNSATVSSTTTDPNPENNTSTAITTIICQTLTVTAGYNLPACETRTLQLTATGSGFSYCHGYYPGYC
jgi:uncharacterized repeat protein (TIGR01451 family)